MCSWQEDVDEEAKGERQKEARPAKNHVLDHRGLEGPCQVLERMDGHSFPPTQRNSQLGEGLDTRQASLGQHQRP